MNSTITEYEFYHSSNIPSLFYKVSPRFGEKFYMDHTDVKHSHEVFHTGDLTYNSIVSIDHLKTKFSVSGLVMKQLLAKCIIELGRQIVRTDTDDSKEHRFLFSCSHNIGYDSV